MPLPQEKSYTYADILAWDDGQRYELYGGQLVALASPSDWHQSISMELSRQIANFLKGKQCKVYTAPFDVRLFEKEGDSSENITDVVQPDILVVCDRSKVDRRGVHGAPDLVIEITSPSTQGNDWREKYNLYQLAGVAEYWIVDPAGHYVAVHHLENGRYSSPILYMSDAKIPVSLWDGFTVDLLDVFPE